MYQHIIDQFIQAEALPEDYRHDITQWYLPLLDDLETRIRLGEPKTLLLGINGAQGTGKSTLATLLATLLGARNFHVASLSIDDFYLGKKQRLQLSQTVHPLLQTRGVPGTHDVDLLLKTLRALQRANSNNSVQLPVFDKAIDDRVAPDRWPEVTGPFDVIILEGWCIGIQPQSQQELLTPVNTLEQSQDADATWRNFVNEQLGNCYQEVFRQIDILLMLQAPGFEQVLQWRGLQEEKLRARSVGQAQQGVMNLDQIRQFIQYFERLTRHGLATLPQTADIVLVLNQQHQVIRRVDNAAQRVRQ